MSLRHHALKGQVLGSTLTVRRKSAPLLDRSSITLHSMEECALTKCERQPGRPIQEGV